MTLCFSDIETRDAFYRVNELQFAFGNSEVEPLCETFQTYIKHLKSKEAKRAAWCRRSPQVKHRKAVIEFMMKVCHAEHLTPETTYLAFYLCDRFMDAHDIQERQLAIIALICVVVAAKLHEKEQRRPTYKKVVRYVPNYEEDQFSSFIHLEKYVLQHFKFDLLIPTEMTFLQFFYMYGMDGQQAALKPEVNNNARAVNLENPQALDSILEGDNVAPFYNVEGREISEAIFETSCFALQECVRAEPSNNFSPSCIAAAALMFARRENGLNFWTPTLEFVTTYSLDDVTKCLREYIELRIKPERVMKPYVAPSFLDTTHEYCLLVKKC